MVSRLFFRPSIPQPCAFGEDQIHSSWQIDVTSKSKHWKFSKTKQKVQFGWTKRQLNLLNVSIIAKYMYKIVLKMKSVQYLHILTSLSTTVNINLNCCFSREKSTPSFQIHENQTFECHNSTTQNNNYDITIGSRWIYWLQHCVDQNHQESFPSKTNSGEISWQKL